MKDVLVKNKINNLMSEYRKILNWIAGFTAALIMFGIGFMVRASRESGVSVTRILSLEKEVDRLIDISKDRQKYIDSSNRRVFIRLSWLFRVLVVKACPALLKLAAETAITIAVTNGTDQI